VKRNYGHCLQLTLPADAEVTLTPMGYDEPVGVPQRYLAEIIGPRAREMASLIAAEVERAGPLGMFPGGIVVTGGGALLRGFAEVVQQQTNLPARVAAPQGLHGMNDEISGPSHATVVGLLRWGARSNLGRRPSRSTARSSDGNGAGGAKFSRWFRELF
jgi:cell division protein FtsA